MHRTFHRVAILIAGVVAVLALAMVPASAVDEGGISGVVGDSAPSACAGNEDEYRQGAENSNFLPINRWRDATGGFHSRLSSRMWNDIPQRANRDGLMTAGMSTGNFFYGLSVTAVTWSTNFCVLDRIGGRIDQVSSNIGAALFDSPLVVTCVVGAVVSASFVGFRRGAIGPALLKTVAVKSVIAGVMLGMIAAAGQSSGAGAGQNEAERDAPYSPGVGSPGYWARTIDDTVTILANGPVYALFSMTNSELLGEGDQGDDILSCDAYVKAMRASYTELYGRTAAQQSASVVPLIMSNMWESAGLATWRNAQYGQENTDFSEYVYCRQLDQQAHIPVTVLNPEWAEGESEDPDLATSAAPVPFYQEEVDAWQRKLDAAIERGQIQDYSQAGVMDKVQPGLGAWMRSAPAKGDMPNLSPTEKENLGTARHGGSPAWEPQKDQTADASFVAWAACRPKGKNKAQQLASITSYKPKDWGARKGAHGLYIPGGIEDETDTWEAISDAMEDAVDEVLEAVPGLDRSSTWHALDASEIIGAAYRKNFGGACLHWFNNPLDSAEDFNWGNQDSIIKRETTEDGKARDYLLTLHGERTSSGLVAVFVYVLSSFFLMIVFGCVSLGVVLARIMAAVMVFAFFLVGIALLASRDAGPLAKFGKSYIGFSFFACAASAILALVALFTMMMNEIGMAMGEPGSLAVVLWQGFSPVMAVWAIHAIFTKILHLPSPFKLSSGLAYGAVAGAAGGAAFAGLDRLGDRAKNRALRSGRNAAGAANPLSRRGGATGGDDPTKRKGAIKPGGSKGTDGDGSTEESRAPATTRKQKREREIAERKEAKETKKRAKFDSVFGDSGMSYDDYKAKSRKERANIRVNHAMSQAFSAKNMKDRVKARVGRGVDAFKASPFKTTAKAAALGAGVAGAAALTPALAAMGAAGYLGYKGTRKVGHQLRPSTWSARNQQRVAEYKAKQERLLAERKAAEQEYETQPAPSGSGGHSPPAQPNPGGIEPDPMENGEGQA